MNIHVRSSSTDGKDYRTTDIDVASTLLCKGYELAHVFLLTGSKANGRKACFVFHGHPAIEDAVQGFWSNRIEVTPQQFANARKGLKSRVYGILKPR